MSTTWIIIIIVLVLGIIVGNILLLKDSKNFKVPKGFKKRKYDDEDDW